MTLSKSGARLDSNVLDVQHNVNLFRVTYLCAYIYIYHSVIHPLLQTDEKKGKEKTS